ncbi:MAG: MATE family efflux transporter [Alphaproteobacteria bacterium]|nr:MATE family efflux transporter [Alphaproteobacteria bacterium]
MDSTKVDSSWKSIFAVTIPMVLSNLSNAILYNIDRAMIIGYSVDAFNAVSVSGGLFAVFAFLFIGIANSAEVYVGQYNGSKNYSQLGAPVWQMVYFSLATAIISFPIAYYAEYLNLLPSYYKNDGILYQKIMMYGSPLFPLFSAFAAFFVGQGKAGVVSFSVVFAAFINIGLDYILIYGVQGYIPPLGAAGAALATIIAEISQILIILIALCTKENRMLLFSSYKFNKELFKGCMKIGMPVSMSNFFAYFAWYLVQSIVIMTSKEEATIYSISVSVYMLAVSFGEGLSKATSAVVANTIGRKDLAETKKAYKKFVCLALLTSAFFVIPLSIFPDQCVFSLLNLLQENISQIYHELAIIMRWISFNVILESLVCVIWGVLVAGGDTIYPSVVYQLGTWGLVVMPIILCFYFGYPTSALLVYQLSFLWLISSLIPFYKRYVSLKWYNKLV